jgi:hypothetical protein
LSLVRPSSSPLPVAVDVEVGEADLIADQSGGMGGMMQELAFAIPGVDEAMGFAEIMKCVSLICVPYSFEEGLMVDMSNQWNSQ